MWKRCVEEICGYADGSVGETRKGVGESGKECGRLKEGAGEAGKRLKKRGFGFGSFGKLC